MAPSRDEHARLARELGAVRRRMAELEAAVEAGAEGAAVLDVEGFREELLLETVRVRRRRGEGALVVLGPDALAEARERHGPSAAELVGSGLLTEVSARSRAGDVVARLDDERLALLLRDGAEAAAASVLERLLAASRQLELGTVVGVSISAGVALLGADEPAALVRRAAGALDEARAAGGARAFLAGAWPGEPARQLVEGPPEEGIPRELYRREAVEALALAQLEGGHRDDDDGRSVVVLACAVARDLGLAVADVEDVRAAALLHGVARAGIPDAVVGMRGPLSDGERAAVARSPLVGERILRGLGGLGAVPEMVRHSRERWDGRGRPDGLAGDAIPLGSRILHACEAYVAMRSERPHRAQMSPDEALKEILGCAGTQFDPQVVAALVTHVHDALEAAAGGDGEPLAGDDADAAAAGGGDRAGGDRERVGRRENRGERARGPFKARR